MSHKQITSKQIKITSDHPSLSGHFPENPVLPGVVILDEVRRGIEDWKHKPMRDITRLMVLERYNQIADKSHSAGFQVPDSSMLHTDQMPLAG